MTTRRTFVQSLAVSSLGLPLLMPKAHAAASVKIALVASLSGPFASAGSVGEVGAKLALRVVGKELGIDARYLSIDDEGNPGRALPKLLSAIQQDGVKLFTGAVLSSVGLAMSSQIASSGGVYMASVGADEITGSQCRKSTFRWPVPSYGAVEQTVRPLIGMFPKAKRWYTITPKYVFGEALLQHCRAVFDEKGVEHVGNGYHSLSDTEFSGIIANAAAAKPDVLALLNFGSQASKALREAVDFGLKSKMKILLVWDAGLEQYQELGSDVLEGVYIGTQYYHDIDSPGNKRIVEIFKAEVNRLPSYSMVNLYTCCELLLRAIKSAGSAEPAAIITALEGMSYVGPTGDESVQAFDHQCVKNYYLVRGKGKQTKRYGDDYVEILSFGKSFLTANRSDCKFA